MEKLRIKKLCSRLFVFIFMFFCVSYCNLSFNPDFTAVAIQENAENSQKDDIATNENQDKNESNDEFKFIKSDQYSDSWFYNENFLLYGGIALILISIVGITLTLKPKKCKRARKNIKKYQKISKNIKKY